MVNYELTYTVKIEDKKIRLFIFADIRGNFIKNLKIFKLRDLLF